MKSAYERALERMEKQGIEPPRADALDDATRAAIAEARQKAEAKLAEIEILHRDGLAAADPATQAEAQARYRQDRGRVEADRDRAIAKLRGE